MPRWSLPAALAVFAAALIGWNLSAGLRLATLSSASRGFRVLSGLGAFLFLPALVIGLLAPTAPGIRVLGPLAWLWPAVTLALLVQAIWAVVAGRSSGAIRASAALIACFNLLGAWVAVARWLESLGVALPIWALAPGNAVSTLAAIGLGGAVFPWGAALLMPALAPAAAARWRSTRAMRALLVVACVAVVGSTAARLPGAVRALAATDQLAMPAPDAGARSDLAIGVRVFGALAGPPSGAIARRDMALADSLGVTALHIELQPSAVTASVLDSLARSMEARRDSITLIVTLTLGGATSPGTGDAEAARLALVDRIVRRLHPDVLLPAERVTHGRGAPSVDGWRMYYDRAAMAARRVDRDVTVALATDTGSPADSALADWVMAGGSRVDAVAVSVRDGGADPARFLEALDATARWASLARVRPGVWIVGVPTAPLVSGEVGQQRLVQHALSWSASRPWVRGVIAGDASDVRVPTALCTAEGRPRRALADVAAALRAARDAPALTAADTTARVDSTANGATEHRSDTLAHPRQ